MRTNAAPSSWRPPMWLQAMLGVCLIACFMPAMGKYTHIQNQQRIDQLRQVPNVNITTMQQSLDRIYSAVTAPVGKTPRDYFVTLLGLAKDRLITQAFPIQYPDLAGRIQFRHSFVDLTYPAQVDDLRKLYSAKFGEDALTQMAAQNPALQQEVSKAIGLLPFGHTNWVPVWTLFLQCYVASIGVAIAFLVVRLRREEMRVLTDLHLILGAAITWPAAVWIYPRFVNPIEQAKRAYRFASWLLASTVSMAAFGGLARAAESESGDQLDGTAPESFILKTLPQPTFSVSGGVRNEKLTDNGFLVHAGPIAWTSASVSYPSGWSFSTWESRSLSGSNGSDENDLTVCKASTSGADTRTGCLSYYDIRPLFSAKGGDLVSPSLELDHALGQSWTVVGKMAGYLNTGSSAKDGVLISVGLQKTIKVKSVSFAQTGSVVLTDGPFLQTAGAQLRYDASVSVPLTRRASFQALWVKAFAPFAGAKDRHPVLSFGMGLSYAF